MKVAVRLFALLLGLWGIVPAAFAECLATSPSFGYDELSQVQNPIDTVGAELNEYAVIVHDLRQDPRDGCDNTELREAFKERLKAQFNHGGFAGFLHGGSASFAYASALILGTRGGLTAEMDDYLSQMPYDASINRNCGYDGFRFADETRKFEPTWTFGDNCTDDFAIAAEGFAWRAAYFQKTSQTVTERRRIADVARRESIRFINEALLNTTKSICVYDKREGANGPTGPCNSTIAEYRAALAAGDEEFVELFPLNHGLDSANYGIGLVASLAHAYAGLEVMGQPVTGADYRNEQDVRVVYEALFRHGQQSAGPNPSAQDDSDLSAWSMTCYRREFPDLFTPADFAQRNQTCQDTDPRYRITLYPVAAFYDYDAHNLPKGDDGQHVQFTRGEFPFNLFNIHNRVAFLGIARHEIYRTMGNDWWDPAHRTALRSRFDGFAFDPATACRRPDPTIDGPVRIEARGTAVLFVREEIPGAKYAWTVKDASRDYVTIEGPADGREVTLRAACRPPDTSFVTVRITVTVTCQDGTELVTSREYGIDVQAPSATVAGGGSTPAGDEINVPVHLTGLGPWWIEWTDNVVEFVERPQSDERPYVHHRREFPLRDVTFQLRSVRGSGTTLETYCSGPVSGIAVYTVTPSTPRSLVFVDEKLVTSGVPTKFTARLAIAQGGPVEGAVLSFTILGKDAGTAVTDAEGKASVDWIVVAPPGVYTDAIRVTYAGREGLRGSTSARALTVRCDEPVLNPPTLNVGGDPQDYVVVVNTTPDCPWDVQRGSDAGWITPSPVNGKGRGVVTLSVPKLDGGSRTGNIFIGGTRLEVRQTGECAYRFVPDVAYVSASGGITALDVVAGPGCEWFVDGNAGFIDLIDDETDNFTDTVRGVGAGRVRFRVSRNQEANAKRTGQLFLHVDDPTGEIRHTASVNQSAPPPETAPVLVRGIDGGSVRNGQNVTMRVLFSGGPATIQWYADNQLIRNGTDESLANLTLAPGTGGYPPANGSVTYRVEVSNSKGSFSDTATWHNFGRTCQVPVLEDSTLHSNLWPEDRNSPSSTANVTLRIVAFHGSFNQQDRTGTLTYKWYRGVAGDRGAEIGTGSDEISVSPNSTAYYWVEVNDPNCGSNQSRTAQVTVSSPPPPRRRRAVGHDFNLDSKNDIPWHNVATGQTEIWAMDGVNRIQTLPVATASAGNQLQSTGDLNADDRPDLIWRNPQTGKNEAWLMSRSNVGWVEQLESRADGNWSIGAVADFDDDNYHDIVWHNNATGANEVWFQTESTHEGTWALPSSPPGWSLHGTGHFNFGDSPDLFFYNRATGQSQVWLMNDAQRAAVASDSVAAAPRRTLRVQTQSLPQMSDPNNVPMLVADLDNNGRADIVWRNTVTGENSVWIMDGTTVSETKALEPRPDPNWQIGGGGPVGSGGSGDTRVPTSLAVTADPAAHGGATVVTATLTANGAGLANRALVFTLNGTDVARLFTAADGTAVAGASVAGIAAGLYPNAIGVRFDGTEQYKPSQFSADLIVERPLPVVTWNDPAPIAYGTPLSGAQLNATASMSGTFVYSPAAGSILNAGFNVLDVTFTPAESTFAPVTHSVVLLVNPAPVAIDWPTPAPIAYGTPLSQAQLRATTGVPGTFTYAPPSGTVLGIGTHTLQVTFVPAQEGNHTSASASVSLTVIQGTQTVSWANPAPIVYGTPVSAAQLNATVATSGIAPAGALTYSPAAGTVLPAGTHTLTVTAAATSFYAAATKSVTLTVNRATPALNWSAPAAIVYGTPLSSAQLNATANVAGTFTYSPATGTILPAGTHTLTAQFTPADATNYNGASATVQLTVVKATPVLSWSAPAGITYGTALSATQLDATSNVAGAFTYSPAAGTVLNAGTHTLSAQFTPADPANYNPGSITTSISVARAPQTLSWAAPAPIVYGTPLSAAQLNATVSVVGPSPAGALTYTPAAGTILQAGPAQTLTVSAAATPNYEPATLSVTIDVLKAKPVLAWATPAPIVYRTALSSAQLNATANVPGTFAYSPSSGTVLEAGTHPLSVHFTPSDAHNYEEAGASVTLEVRQAAPVITWPRPAGIVYGTPLGATQLDASADVPGAFTYTPAAGTVLNAGAQTLSAAFVPSDARNYRNVSASVTIDVARAPQTLSWAAPAPIVYGTPLSAAQLNATVSVVGPSPAGALTYTPAAGTILQAGPAQTLTVSAAATPNYEPATLSVTVDVLKAKPVLAWATPAPIVYRTALSSAQLNATANVPGTFAYSPAAGTVLEAGMQPLTAHFTPDDTRNYEEAGASVTLEVQQATPVITWPRPAGIVYGTTLGTTQLDASADVPGAFTYTPPAGTILDAGDAQTLSVDFVPADTRNFRNVSASVTIDVARAPQTLSWAAPAPIVYGTPLSSAQLAARVSVVGPAAAGALVYTPSAGTVLDAGSRTLTVTALETPNYLSATMSVSLEVNRAPLSLVVDAKSKLYGAPVPALTGTLTGVRNDDPIAPSYSTSGTMQSNTGLYPIAATLVDPAGRVVNYDVTIVPSTLTVLPAPLQIAANPATSQYSDPLAQLGATFTGFVLGETPNHLGGTLAVTTTATPLSAPDTYPIAIGGLTSSNYAIVYVPSPYTVTREDARAIVTSPLFVTAPASKPATITLSATVKDISATADAAGDASAGDIRKATLTFVDRATGAVLCTASIGLVSADDTRIGVATCTVAGTFPPSLTVGAGVAGYYVRNDAVDDAVVTISAPTADSVTGSGNLVLAGSPAKVNVNLKHDKHGVARGNFTLTFQRTVEGAVRRYEVSATAIDSLAIRRGTAGGTAGGTAIITGTAVLRDVTTTTPVVLDAAAPLIATATDNGEPSAADTVSIALLRKEGGFWLSVDWNGDRTVPQAVQGGNLQIHQSR